jgi:16S rRNA (adenine(1408)-N(1))-methyltransferase
LFIGLDANAAALRERSGRAARARQPNVLYIRAAIEDLPPELTGVADRITVVLPWGSLLTAVVHPASPLLGCVRGLAQPGARLTVVLALDPQRDRAELLRLDLPTLDAAFLEGPLAGAWAAVGFRVTSVRPLTPAQLAEWPSTWARRLAHGQERSAFRIDARAF